MKTFIKNLLSNNTQSVMRLGFLWMLLIITYMSIFYLIFSAKAKCWGIDIQIIKDISATLITIVGIIFTGKLGQKIVEVWQDNKTEDKEQK
jgi:hypothetical protein